MQRHQRVRTGRAWLWLPLMIGVAGCGGGGGGGGGDRPTMASDQFAQQCAPLNPFVDDASQPTTTASLTREKQWLAAYMDEAYLWREQIPAVDASRPEFSDDGYVHWSLFNYFNALLTPEVTASGKPLDAFSFIYPTRLWQELSESGLELGYGLLARYNDEAPRDMRVMYVDEDAPADRAGVQRGARITHIDGSATDRMSEDAIRDALYPRAEGDQHRFTFESAGTAVSHTLVAERVAKDPVPQAQLLRSGDRMVGYLLFNDHFETAEAPLIAAIEQFRDAGVDDLIVDLRYNGGGYLYIASQLAYMIAGPERVGGRVFERLVFNERRQQQLSGSQADFPFVDCRSEGNFNCRNGTLPTLDLPRLHVITSGGSCSASEALINGLRGIDVDVRLIGDTTCGKPFGFYARDNCGLTYFPIEFQGVNAKGYGDYADGFPADCAAADDLDHALGDPRERMLAAALRLRSGAPCGSAKSLSHGHTLLFRPPPRENRLLRSH